MRAKLPVIALAVCVLRATNPAVQAESEPPLADAAVGTGSHQVDTSSLKPDRWVDLSTMLAKSRENPQGYHSRLAEFRTMTEKWIQESDGWMEASPEVLWQIAQFAGVSRDGSTRKRVVDHLWARHLNNDEVLADEARQHDLRLLAQITAYLDEEQRAETRKRIENYILSVSDADLGAIASGHWLALMTALDASADRERLAAEGPSRSTAIVTMRWLSSRGKVDDLELDRLYRLLRILKRLHTSEALHWSSEAVAAAVQLHLADADHFLGLERPDAIGLTRQFVPYFNDNQMSRVKAAFTKAMSMIAADPERMGRIDRAVWMRLVETHDNLRGAGDLRRLCELWIESHDGYRTLSLRDTAVLVRVTSNPSGLLSANASDRLTHHLLSRLKKESIRADDTLVYLLAKCIREQQHANALQVLCETAEPKNILPLCKLLVFAEEGLGRLDKLEQRARQMQATAPGDADVGVRWGLIAGLAEARQIGQRGTTYFDFDIEAKCLRNATLQAQDPRLQQFLARGVVELYVRYQREADLPKHVNAVVEQASRRPDASTMSVADIVERQQLHDAAERKRQAVRDENVWRQSVRERLEAAERAGDKPRIERYRTLLAQ